MSHYAISKELAEIPAQKLVQNYHHCRTKECFLLNQTPHLCRNRFVAVLIPVSARESLPLRSIHCSPSRTDKKCGNRPETKTHWNHASAISWHIITWFTNSEFSIEEWREFAVFTPLQLTTVASSSLPGCRQLSPAAPKGLNSGVLICFFEH